MIHFIRFLHVLLGVTLAGLFVANYFYIRFAINEKNLSLLAFTLKKSILGDCIFFLPAIMLLFITGSYQVIVFEFSLKTPWIISAYLFFACFSLCWLVIFFLKITATIHLEKDPGYLFNCRKLFHSLNILSLLFLLVIIHDAVRKMTFIPWEFLVR